MSSLIFFNSLSEAINSNIIRQWVNILILLITLLIYFAMIRILRRSHLALLNNNRQYFASEKPKKKIQTVGFTSNNIESIKNLGFKVSEPIKFTEGKFLIYKSKSSILRTFSDYFIHTSGIAFMAYLIYTRHNMDLFPVVFHGYVAGIAFFSILFFRKYLKHQHIVKEIYLLEGGKATQIVFQNQFKRKLFGEILHNTYYNSLFVSPKQQPPIFKSIYEFPKSVKEIQKRSLLGKYWKKFYSNYENFILIPQNYQFMHKEILNEVMNGKVIICK